MRRTVICFAVFTLGAAPGLAQSLEQVDQRDAAGSAPNSHSHTISATVATSDHGPLLGRLGWGFRFGRFGLGLDAAASWAADVAVDGRVVKDALRLRARVPLLLHFSGSERLAADLVLAGGIRSLSSQAASAIAATADVAFVAQLALSDTWRLHAGTLLPLAFDLTGGRELALFPGLGLLAGVEFNVSPTLSLHLQGMLAAPEGYGGDGAKSVVELGLSLRWRFGDPAGPRWILLPEAL
jgi:hypothetical protein